MIDTANAVGPLAGIAGGLFVRLARREKRPIGRDWPALATPDLDEVAAWLRAGANVGLLLGPETGLVDIEFDQEEGRDALHALGIDATPTPTWTSERGEHRLFRWAPWMAAVGWRKAGALELRIGGNPAQSVLPPSIHPSGAPYRWLLSPLDAEPAEFPESLAPMVTAGPMTMGVGR
jgi:hypothetical protein